MKTYFTPLAAAAVALTVAAPSLADSRQLAAAAGLSPAEAAELSLTEIAQAKFNHDTRGDDRQVIVRDSVASPEGRAQLAVNAGVATERVEALTLTELAAAKFNRESGGDDQQRIERGSVTVASRSVGDNGAWTQLIRSAGLTREEAAGLSLTTIAAAKFDRDTD